MALTINITDPFTGLVITSELTYSTNRTSGIILTGQVSADVVAILATDSKGRTYSSQNAPSGGVTEIDLIINPTANPGYNTWQFKPVLDAGENVFTIIGFTADSSPTNPLIVTLINATDSSLAIQITAPTGLRVRRSRNKVEVIWIQNPEPQIRGYNVYASPNPAGGTDGYVQINPTLVSTPAFFEDVVVSDNQVIVSETISNNTTTRVTQDTQQVQRNLYYLFPHNRLADENDLQAPAINNTIFNTVPDTQNVYYVVTAVGYDDVNRQEVESVYSAEVYGTPLTIDTSIKDLTVRRQNDVARSFITAIHRTQEAVSVVPGTVTRDIHINPPSNEFEQAYFLLDFSHRSQSFLTLLAIDDANGDGESDTVASSPYKQALQLALGLAAPSDAQLVIDDAFTKLAGNFKISRKGSLAAFGQAVFYTNIKPQTDVNIPTGAIVATNGSPSTQFTVTSPLTVAFADLDSYYNLNNARYEFTVNIEAVAAGSAGNQAAGSINTIVSGVPANFRVVNTEATIFGQDEESNASLAERAMLAFESIDTGTAGGYLSTALAQPGVLRAQVIDAGNELMQRDYDEVRHKHIGGKVDVYVQGQQEKTVTDTFAFTFANLSLQFNLISSINDLVFEVNDPRITPDTPIFTVFAAVNQINSYAFNLNNLQITDYNKIKFSLVDNPSSGTVNGTTLLVDFRYRASDRYIFKQQPVRQLVSVVGSDSGVLPLASYTLVSNEDPLDQGKSTLAHNALLIRQVNGIPTGNPTTITNEPHVMIGSNLIPLNSVGVRTSSIVVKSLDQTITYLSDLTSTTPDYYVQEGGLTDPTTIQRNPAGNITDGQEVLVSYVHEENFNVTYITNGLLGQLQTAINGKKHVTADVLVKETVLNDVDIECTIVLKANADQATVDSQVRTNVSRFINSTKIGQNIYQSDIVNLIENVSGIEHVVIPFAKMVKADDSVILREPVDNAAIKIQSGSTDVYLLTQALEFNTTDTGGPSNLHKGVFQDERPLTLVDSFSVIGNAPAQGFIIGKNGISIPGYTDLPQNVGKQAELTGNRVVVSVLSGDTPAAHVYTVSYIVNGETGSKDIPVAAMESLALGKFTITYTRVGA